MKYEIEKEGGFIGLSKQYRGEIKLGKDEKAKIIDALKSTKKENLQLRDGFKYRIKFIDESLIFQNTFNEKDLPKLIREFIDEIVNTKGK